MATTVRKQYLGKGETLRLKKLSSGKYSITLNGDRLEDPIDDRGRAENVFEQSIKDIKRGRKSMSATKKRIGFSLSNAKWKL